MTDTVIKMTTRIRMFDATCQAAHGEHLIRRCRWAPTTAGGLFETYGEALDFVRKSGQPGTVWTLVDDDDGGNAC